VFYDKFEELCAAKGISVTKALTEIGLSRGLGTKWRKTGAIPNGKTLAKISAYFNVPVDYFTRMSLTEAMDVAMRSLPGYVDPIDTVTPEPVDDIVKFALFGDVNVDDDIYDEVKRFAAFAKAQREKDKK
jgi:transcriptional regulator with XRE-family HTH domain